MKRVIVMSVVVGATLSFSQVGADAAWLAAGQSTAATEKAGTAATLNAPSALTVSCSFSKNGANANSTNVTVTWTRAAGTGVQTASATRGSTTTTLPITTVTATSFSTTERFNQSTGTTSAQVTYTVKVARNGWTKQSTATRTFSVPSNGNSCTSNVI